MGLRLLIFAIIACSSLQVWAYTPEEDQKEIALSREQCELVKKFAIGRQYKVDCGELYQQYNVPTAATYRPVRGEVKIASFNLYYPGSYKAVFKDFSLLAKLMNRWDVIAGQELVNIMGQDAKHNEDVLNFVNSGTTLIDNYLSKVSSTEGEIRAQWEQKLASLKADLQRAPDLYRAPGYLRLLAELRKLDKSWSLVITPRSEAAETSHIQELSGYFYRAGKVRLRLNPHCQESYQFASQAQVACLPNLRESFMGRDVGQIFSRRPFMASFESNGFSFNLLTSHVVFTSPGDPEKMAKILLPSFGVSDYLELGTGATKAKYARFAELKMILEFMNRYRNKYRDSRLVYLGDTNIEADNPFWPQVLNSYPGSDVMVDEQTTLTQRRYSYNGAETNGLASNYDHFIYNPKHVPECNDEQGIPKAHAYNYLDKPFVDDIVAKYLVRDIYPERLIKSDEDADDLDLDLPLGIDADYEINPNYIYKRDNLLNHYEAELRGLETIKGNSIVWDDYRFEEMLEIFERRMFGEQLYDRTYYRFIIEAISDHLPVVLNCQTGS